MNMTPVTHVHKHNHVKTKTDVAIEQIINNDKPLTQSDLNRVYTVAQTEPSYAKYRDAAKSMTESELRDEKHLSSRMAEFLRRSGDPRPHPLCDCHAIICGSHPRAAQLRLVLAKHGMRIDDIYNACWLPRNTKSLPHMPTRLRNAIPHSRIHRKNYFQFLSRRIRLLFIKNEDQLKSELKHVSFLLQSGAVTKDILNNDL